MRFLNGSTKKELAERINVTFTSILSIDFQLSDAQQTSFKNLYF